MFSTETFFVRRISRKRSTSTNVLPAPGPAVTDKCRSSVCAAIFCSGFNSGGGGSTSLCFTAQNRRFEIVEVPAGQLAKMNPGISRFTSALHFDRAFVSEDNRYLCVSVFLKLRVLH